MRVSPAAIDHWISARDQVAIRDAFDALPSTRHAMGGQNRRLTLHGAALLAGAMLGERADWMCERDLGPATYQHSYVTDDGTWFDHAWRIAGRCQTDLLIHERRDGLRGVQSISVSAGTVPGEGRPEGGGMRFVRVFDASDPAGVRAASVPINSFASEEVAVIGDVDLTPLDLFMSSGHFAHGGGKDVATARALVAQLIGDVDAHFDTSTEWLAGANLAVPTWYAPDTASHQTFVAGERAVSVSADRLDRINAYVHGLPWGWQFGFQISQPGTASYYMQMPTTALDRIEARFATLKG